MGRDLTFYDRTGKPVAYIYENTIYGFNGHQFGWFENGWIRDLNGARVFYSENATGGPVKPIKQIKPIKGIKNIKPIKGIKAIRRIKPIFSYSWSTLSAEAFFKQ